MADASYQPKVYHKQGGDELVVASGGTITVEDGGTQTFGAAHGGVLHGAGTSSAKYTMTGASKSALSYYITTADTADSNRAMYLRLYLTGAAGGGEALRSFLTLEGAGSPAARAQHNSISFGASATVTGESMVTKNTFHVPNSALAAGTSSIIQAELYSDGASSDIGSGTLAFFHAHHGGNATGAAVIDAKTYLLHIDGCTDGSGEFVRRAQNEPTWTSKTCLIKCLVNGNVTYLVGVEL